MSSAKTIVIAFALVVLMSSCTNNREGIEALAKAIQAKQAVDAPATLKPFVPDGCSYRPDGDWLACCVQHDFTPTGRAVPSRIEKRPISSYECVLPTTATGSGAL